MGSRCDDESRGKEGSAGPEVPNRSRGKEMVPLVPRRKADMHLPPIRLLFSRPLSFLVCYSVRGNSHRNQYNSVKVPWVTLS